jgi:small GTP-binding protein
MTNISYDESFKCILLGDQYVGKSSLVNLLMKNEVSNDYKCTVGIEFSSKIISLNNNVNIKCLIWDTAGQERYRTITNTYYKGSDGVIVIFSCVDLKSFIHCKYWLDEVIERLDVEKCVVYLIGNKSDLTDQRVVYNEQIIELVAEYGKKIPHLKYIECSILNSSNNERNIFKDLCNELYLIRGRTKFLCNEKDDDIIILENFKEEPSGSCCST